MNRVRELTRSLYDRLVVVPVLFVVCGIVVGFGVVRVDKLTSDSWLPTPLRSTVDSADSILSTIAGGLIAAITLLLSMTLVAVQLASSQFSPRTITDWIGDRTQQVTIGLVLGTTVFCLMVLRETQSLEDREAVSPDVSVLLAVALMVICLVAVVRSVGHLSNKMQIGTVARTLMDDTIESVRVRAQADASIAAPGGSATVSIGGHVRRSDAWTPAVAARSGWLRTVDWDEITQLAADGSTIELAVPIGTFVFHDAPVAWIERPASGIAAPIELGIEHVVIDDRRRVGDDPSYGILQMNDVVLRALSPGVNDPNTARDVVSYLGVVLLVLWETPSSEGTAQRNGRTVVTVETTHEEFLDFALGQVIRYGASDVSVVESVARVLDSLESETQRRSLPGPVAPIRAMRERLTEAIEHADHVSSDMTRLRNSLRRSEP